ncbi:MAG: helix-turn-helix transcriptional regulator [Sphingomonadaceae bacterium]|nr:helix-turn-helix transcriptional regulator [Sphingomonadaceae bacterium]
MSDDEVKPAIKSNRLGEYLNSVRRGLDLSLRDVEEITNKEVSNAYLSQLENGKIEKPSPHILHSLSLALKVGYEDLMERAGYIKPNGERSSESKHGKAATFAIENLTVEEEEALLKHLAYIRWQTSQ